jgi:threonine/homoserine/homoserine lactone efflux protein
MAKQRVLKITYFIDRYQYVTSIMPELQVTPNAHYAPSLAATAALWYSRHRETEPEMQAFTQSRAAPGYLPGHRLYRKPRRSHMLELTHLPLFIVASAVLILTPGPAVLYIVARSVDQGRRAGLVSVSAIEVGNFVHVIAATLGLSALLLSSAMAFAVVKYLGAAYLVYLGLRKLFSGNSVQATAGRQPQSLRRTFSQGVVVAALNPKTALFFVAFLPQFVDPSRGAVGGQMLVLGCIFVMMALASDSMYALLAGTAALWLKGSRSVLGVQRYMAGSVYIGLGVAAALADAHRP